jgi:hypothetical protein
VLVVGLLLSATEVAALPSPTEVPLLTGIGALVTAAVLGTITYTVSFPVAGPGPAAIEDLLAGGYDETEWLAVLLDRYGQWIETNARTNYLNGALLAGTQLSLVAGVVSLGIGLLWRVV